jgi:hypothetical protein
MNKVKEKLGISIIILSVFSLCLVTSVSAGNPRAVREAAALYQQGIITDYGIRIYPAWFGNEINHDEPSFVFLGWVYVDDGVTNEFKDYPQPLKYELVIGGEEIHLQKNALGRGEFKETGAAGFPWEQTIGPVYYFYQTFEANYFEPGVYSIHWEITAKDPASPSDRIIYVVFDSGILTVN